MKRVLFVPRNSMENLAGDWSDWAAISISDPVGAFGRIKLPGKFIHALHLAFHDADPRNEDQSGEYLVYLSEDDARTIVGFVRTVAPLVQGFIVNCHGGVSRSAAIAKWIAGEYRLPFDFHYSRFNKHVYETLVRVGQGMKQ
jgi:predicted protein tyrosine phosphatase